ncbi:MAG: acetoacetate--CoA ligase [Gammaproteobacteria bacterium]|nr:acetoacetate--CoA ligase [Gammaproteobacteria bacterium]
MEPLWRPRETAMRESAMFAFMQRAAARYGFAEDYDALYKWSIENRAEFWNEVWDFTGVIASKKSSPEDVLQNGGAMPGAKWFSGSQLNFAENMLRRRDDAPAILFYGEDGSSRTLTYAELYKETARVSAGLRALGLRAGDRVAGYLRNTSETVVAMLAASSIGAVWSSCSPDFGAAGVLERFGQIRPRILFAADGYTYNGKYFDMRAAVQTIARELDSIEHVIVVPFDEQDTEAGEGMLSYANFAKENASEKLLFAQLPFDHPLCILYSSGTTGAPKCIVHGAGGTLLQHLKEHQLHVGLRENDVFFFITTCGWMMWNWLVSGLASGCALVLYDGAPFHPRPSHLWEIAERARISIFGGGARYIAALAKHRVRPRDFNLGALRAVLSTGSPLAPESFDYIYKEIKTDVHLASISGGTDIVSCFVLGNPLRPVWRGEIQGAGLGMDARVYDANSAPAPPGSRGELVCARAFPSMPLGFWGNNAPEDNEKYRAAYFSRYENTWAHGDFAERTENDGFIIHGRSDAVLNPGGVRIGTAEIYREVEKFDEILESICIAQKWGGDVRVVLFVQLREGAVLSGELKSRIRAALRENASPRHIPKKILAVADIPRTLSGKIVELAVRSVVHGEKVANRAALANPEALECFRDLPELREE